MHTSGGLSVWSVESSRGLQTLYGVAGAILGGVFIFASRIDSLEQITRTSVLLMGILIAVISLAVLIMGGKQVITVDPGRRHIALESISRFGAKKRLIPFSRIAGAGIGELGDKEGGSISYHVVLKLNDGKEVALFIGAFEGAYDRAAMEARCRRINDCLNVQSVRSS